MYDKVKKCIRQEYPPQFFLREGCVTKQSLLPLGTSFPIGEASAMHENLI